jgi:hypothetical protein
MLRARHKATLALAGALIWLAPAIADEPAAPDVAAPPAGKKFDHTQHRGLEKPAVTDDNCESCHPTDKVGILTPPGKSGHQPCMSSGCHVTDFLSVGAATQKSDPARYKKAAAFCMGCHSSKTGDPPKNYEKPPADLVFTEHPAPNFHVELPHFEHLDNEIKGKGKLACRDCHVVDPRTNELDLQTPGHAECAKCHGVSAAPMKTCDHCHKMPGKRVYLDKIRKETEVRSCDSPGHLREAKRRGKPVTEVPCFKHETKDHRFGEDGKPLECGACHYMFENKKLWGKHKYDDLKNIAAAPVMDNRRDEAHKTCGASKACHARDVRLSSSGRQCKLCHSNKLVENSMFD